MQYDWFDLLLGIEGVSDGKGVFAMKDEEVCGLVLPCRRTGLGFQEEIVCIACPQPVGRWEGWEGALCRAWTGGGGGGGARHEAEEGYKQEERRRDKSWDGGAESREHPPPPLQLLPPRGTGQVQPPAGFVGVQYTAP